MDAFKLYFQACAHNTSCKQDLYLFMVDITSYLTIQFSNTIDAMT